MKLKSVPHALASAATVSKQSLVHLAAALALCVANLCVAQSQPSAPGAPAEQLGGAGDAAESSPGLRQAVARFRVRDFDGALAALEEVAKENPEHPPAEVFMADMFRAIQDAASARAWLERAVFEHPNDPKAYLLLGDINVEERHLVDAYLLYSSGARLIQKIPADDARRKLLEAHARRGLADVAELRGDWAMAQRHLEFLVGAAPDNALLVQRLGRVLFFQDKPEEALAQFKRALRLDGKLLAPDALMGQLYERKGDRASATRYMRRALQAHAEDLDTRLAVAHWALSGGELAMAQEQADAALRIDGKSLAALLLAGTVALYLEDFPQAEKRFAAVLARTPGHFAAANGLTLALCEQDDAGKKNRALEQAQDDLRRHPTSTEAVATLGWVYYRLGRYDEADRVLSQIVLASDLSPTAAYYVARMAVRKGRTELAQHVLEAALKTKVYFAKRPDAEYLYRQLSQQGAPP